MQHGLLLSSYLQPANYTKAAVHSLIVISPVFKKSFIAKQKNKTKCINKIFTRLPVCVSETIYSVAKEMLDSPNRTFCTQAGM